MKLLKVILLIVILSGKIFSQEFITEEEATGKKDKPGFWSRTSFGGIIGMTFGDYTSVVLQPEIAYWATDNWAVGTGIIYEYTSYTAYGVTQRSTIYGAKFFTHYFIWENLFITGILETVSLETKYYDYANRYPNKERFWFASPLVGAGYMQRIGSKSGVSLSVLFNLNQDRNSPYYYQPMPIIRVGFSI